MSYSILDVPTTYLAAPNPKYSSDFWTTVLENKENIFNPSGDNNTLNVESRPTTPMVEPRPTIPLVEPIPVIEPRPTIPVIEPIPVVEPRPTIPMVEYRPEVFTVEPRPSSSQVNTHRAMDINNFIWREDIHGYKYPSQGLQTNPSINSHINYNVSNTMNSSSYTFQSNLNPTYTNYTVGNQSNLNPTYVNYTVGNQNTIMQNVAESSFQAQSNMPEIRAMAESSFQAQSNISEMRVIAESSSQAQSNISEMRVITESGFTKPNLKPIWIENYSNVVDTATSKCFNPMFSSLLPWQEIQLSEITKLNRPKIVGINFDFSHQNIEAVLQEFMLPKAFYVSHEHVPGLTPSNYKEYIINYYHTKACNKPSILLQAVLIENGDVLKVIKGR
uniref:Uncharacterized protein n=1 Tax=Beauveria bassiana TaxID=176275 RepID=A0A4Y5QSE6_BEABA|nr:hypothetical protein [Beauveria bassiana]